MVPFVFCSILSLSNDYDFLSITAKVRTGPLFCLGSFLVFLEVKSHGYFPGYCFFFFP